MPGARTSSSALSAQREEIRHNPNLGEPRVMQFLYVDRCSRFALNADEDVRVPSKRMLLEFNMSGQRVRSPRVSKGLHSQPGPP